MLPGRLRPSQSRTEGVSQVASSALSAKLASMPDSTPKPLGSCDPRGFSVPGQCIGSPSRGR